MADQLNRLLVLFYVLGTNHKYLDWFIMSFLQLQDLSGDAKDAQAQDPKVEGNNKEEKVLPKEGNNDKESES